jgi:biotin carboxylase
MKHFFKKAGVPVIPYADRLTLAKLKKFAATQGYPVSVKPDKGSGASMTYKISNDKEAEEFFDQVPGDIDFIAEEFVDGIIVTYDGLSGPDGEILFESSTMYEQSIMDVVNEDNHVHYVTMAQIPEDVRDAGQRIIKAFGAREKFFHIELFRSRKNQEIIALEVNMRPPGAWMTDAINFTYDMDIYREWANMIVNGKIDGPFTGKYYTAYASRKHHKNYALDHREIMDKLNGSLVKHEEIAPVFSRAMGNYAYQVRSGSLEELRQMIRIIQEERKH